LKKKKDISFFQSLSLLTAIGTVMIANLGVSLFIGKLIDTYLGSQPWFTLIFIILGSISGMRAIMKLIK